jgi:hypothetical protein
MIPFAVHAVEGVEALFAQHGFKHITCPNTAIAAVNVLHLLSSGRTRNHTTPPSPHFNAHMQSHTLALCIGPPRQSLCEEYSASPPPRILGKSAGGTASTFLTRSSTPALDHRHSVLFLIFDLATYWLCLSASCLAAPSFMADHCV